MSIRRALVVTFAVLLTAIGALAAIVSYTSARREAWDSLDLQQRQIARFVGNGENIGVPDATLPAHEGDEDFFIEIRFKDGRPMRRSSAALAFPASTPPGFSDYVDPGGTWRVFTEDRADKTIRVAQRTTERDEIATDSAVRSAVPLLLAIPVLWVVTYLLVGLVMRRLVQVADAVEARSAGDITPIDERHVPFEIRPLIAAINRAFARLGEAIDRQQAFLSDAAHELRTPLAAVSVQVDVLKAENRDPGLGPTIGALDKATRRAAGIIAQLLKLARQDAGSSRPPPLETVSLDRLVTDAVGALVPLAEAKAIDLGLSRLDPATIRGVRPDIVALVEALVDNAVRYTPPGGTVDVAVESHPTGSGISVVDTGPGIPEASLPQVFERFFRLAGEESGTGLGLAIARTIVERHGGAIAIANRQDRSGLSVRVTFPWGGG